MSPQLQQDITLVIPIILGIAIPPLFNLIKRVAGWVGEQPATVQRLLVLLVAAVLNYLAQLFGVTAPTSLGGVDATWLNTFLSAGLAYGLHAANQLSTVKTTQQVVAETQGILPPTPKVKT